MTAISSKPVNGAWYDQIIAKWKNKLENIGLKSVEIVFDLSKPEESTYFNADNIELETLLTEMGVKDKYGSLANKLSYYRFNRVGSNGSKLIRDLGVNDQAEICEDDEELLKEMDRQILSYTFELKEQMLAELKQTFADVKKMKNIVRYDLQKSGF